MAISYEEYVKNKKKKKNTTQNKSTEQLINEYLSLKEKTTTKSNK